MLMDQQMRIDSSIPLIKKPICSVHNQA